MNTKAEFWANVDKNGPVPIHHPELGQCWLWTRARVRRGYGMVCFKGTTRRAHRVAFEITKGPIPDETLICHHCDNPPCVRPRHLFPGTSQDNAQDREQKGRHPHLCSEKFSLDAHLVRTLLASRGLKVGTLASQVGMNANHFYSLLESKTVLLPHAQKIATCLNVDLSLLAKKPLSEEELAVRLACTVLGPPFHSLLLSVRVPSLSSSSSTAEGRESPGSALAASS